MSLDVSSLGPLVLAVESGGAPILAAALRAAAPIIGDAVPLPFARPIVTMLLNALADQFGGDASDPQGIADKIIADPDAASKLQKIQDDHKDDLESALAFAKNQVEQNNAELNAAPTASWRDLVGRAFFAGWRPMKAWQFVMAFGIAYIGAWRGWSVPDAFMKLLGVDGTLFMVLIGARSGDKIFGVATDSLKSVSQSGASIVKQALNRAIRR